MKVSLTQLSKEEFYKLNTFILFNDETTSRNFGVITDGKEKFALAWQSDLIKPVITEIRENVVCVGIDQNFVIINFNDNTVPLKIELTYYFMTTTVFRERIFVATQLEIIKIDKATFKVQTKYELPDFFEEIIIRGNNLEVTCIEGNSLTLD